jgi:hypothetical protein
LVAYYKSVWKQNSQNKDVRDDRSLSMNDLFPKRTSGRRLCGNLRPTLGFGHGGGLESFVVPATKSGGCGECDPRVAVIFLNSVRRIKMMPGDVQRPSTSLRV